MQNTERQKFEESWKSAFDGAESTPPDRVWNSIELDLAGQESATMRKKVVFYQRLAAAMLLFALSAGVYAYYSSQRELGAGSKELGVRSKELGVGSKELGDAKVEKNDNGNTNSVQHEAPVIPTPDTKEEQQQISKQLAVVEE